MRDTLARPACPSASHRSGFTLIELVVVLTVIAVLAAIALPRFINLQRDARIGHLLGVRGAVASAAMLVHAALLSRRGVADPAPCPADTRTIADNQLVGPGTACTEGGVVRTMNGYPAATAPGVAGIISAAGLGTSFNPTATELANDGYLVTAASGTTTFARIDATTPATCGFTYSEPATASTAATFTAAVTTGC